MYDPATGSWSSTTGSLATARYDHTATLLPTGKVLVAGGQRGGASLSSAELYDLVVVGTQLEQHRRLAPNALSHSDAAAFRQGAGGRGNK